MHTKKIQSARISERDTIIKSCMSKIILNDENALVANVEAFNYLRSYYYYRTRPDDYIATLEILLNQLEILTFKQNPILPAIMYEKLVTFCLNCPGKTAEEKGLMIKQIKRSL